MWGDEELGKDLKKDSTKVTLFIGVIKLMANTMLNAEW